MRDKFCGIGQFDNTGWESYHMKLELYLIEEHIIPEDSIWKLRLSTFLDPENPDRSNEGREMKVKIEGLNKRCSQINEINIINAITGVSIWNAISIKRIKEEGGGPDDTKLILEIPGTDFGFVSIDTFSDEQWKHLVVHEESFQPAVAAQVKKRKRHKKSKKSKRKKLSKKHSKKHGRKSKKHKKSKKHIKSKKHKKSKK